MKTFITYLFGILALGGAGTLEGQIEINMKDHAREGVYYYGNRSSAGLRPGLSGKGQLWDFSAYTPQSFDTIIIKGYEQKGDGNTANMIKLNGRLDTLEWLNRNTEWMATVMPLQLIDTMVYRSMMSMQFPWKFNDNVKDSIDVFFELPGYMVQLPDFDSVRIDYRMWVSNFVDGEGTLKLGIGTFPALRMRSQTEVRVWVYAKNGSDPYELIPDLGSEEYYTQYHYLSPDFGYTAAIFDQELSSITFSVAKVLSHKEVDDFSSAEVVFANPMCADWKLNNKGNQTWEVALMDITGKMVVEPFELKGLEVKEVPVEQLSDGVFLIQLRNKATGQTLRKKVTK